MSGGAAVRRLVWRDIRRHPWRMLMIVLLIAVPVAAATFVVVTMRSGFDTNQLATDRLGNADAILQMPPEAAEVTRMERLLQQRPSWRTVAVSQGRLIARLPTGQLTRIVATRVSSATDPMVAPLFRVLQGTLPTASDEVLLAEWFARDRGYSVGDRLELTRPVAALRVVGIAEGRLDGDVVTTRQLAVAPQYVLIDAPGGISSDDQRPEAFGGNLMTRDQLALLDAQTSDTTQTYVVPMYLVIALGLGAFGLIVAAALSAGSRRQMRELGLLGASGATPGQAAARTQLTALIAGVVGAVGGIALGAAIIALLRPNLERWLGNRLDATWPRLGDGLLLVLFAIGVAWLAALGPSRVAQRTSVLAALGGRRPVRTLGRRTLVIGVAVFGVGCLAVALVAARPDMPNRAVAMTVAVAIALAGLVICAPYLVGLLEPVAARLRGSGRLALRNVARQRGRTGPIVAAVMAAGALAIGSAAFVKTVDRHDANQPWVGSRAAPGVVIGSVSYSDPQTQAVTVATDCAASTAVLRTAVLPILDRGRLVCRIARRTSFAANGQPVAIIAPDDLVALGQPDIARRLAAGVAIDTSGDDVMSSVPGVDVERMSDRRRRAELYGLTEGVGSLLISPATATKLAAQLAPASTPSPIALARQDRPFSAEQLRRLNALRDSDPGIALSTASRDVDAGLVYDDGSQRVTAAFILYTIILPIAVLLTLLTVAIGLYLLTVEARDERTALVALGAGPTQRREQNAWQAGAMALLGIVLAVPAGIVLPYIVVHWTRSLEYVAPWDVVALLVVGLPALAALGAYLLTRPRVPAIPRRT